MAKRPKFDLPSTKADAPAAKSEWVYRSDAPVAVVEPQAVTPATDTAPLSGDAIVSSYASYAAGAGLIPLPVVDLLTIGSLQLKMLAALAECYQVPFNRDLGKSVLASLLGTVTTRVGSGLVRSVLKTIPGIGSLVGALAMPAMAYGVTYAVGRVFVKHFESGGTLVSFDAAAAGEHFTSELSKATS